MQKFTSSQKLRILDKITRYSLDMICLVDSQGCFTYVSDACRNILGYEPEEMSGRYFGEFVLPADKEKTRLMAKSVRTGASLYKFTNTYLHKQGHPVPLCWSGGWSGEDNAVVCIARNVTEETAAQRELFEKEELHRALSKHGADVLSLLDEEGRFLLSSGATLAEFGYAAESLTGTSVFDYFHPSDVAKVKSAFYELLMGQDVAWVEEARFRTAAGEWRWIEATISNQLHKPGVRAIVSSSRDVTARVQDKQRIREGEQRFRSLFENHTDAVVYQNREGCVMDVNPEALALLEQRKEQVVGRPFADFLPAETVPVCEQMLMEAFCGAPVRFELAVPSDTGGEMTFDVLKIPVHVEGVTTGVYSILRDVTESRRARGIIERQAEKLHRILESITDAFFVLDREWRFSYVNSTFATHEGFRKEELVGQNIWQVFPRLASTAFHRECLELATEGGSRHFEESYAYSGKVYRFNLYRSQEGISAFFTDITEITKSREEVEKLSLVADHTSNGVVIFRQDRRVEWVNQGFVKMTGYSFEEAIGKLPIDLLYHEQTDKQVLAHVRERMEQARPVSFEVLNRKKSGEDLWLFIEINPVFDVTGKVERYVAIQTDITSLKKSEQELSQLSRDLHLQNSDLQQFTYIVSHNLRAPVANVLGLAKLLNREARDSALYDVAVQNLQESAIQLDSVVRDVSTILSIRDSKSLVQDEVAPEEVCRQACQSLQGALEECGGRISLDMEAGVTICANKAYLYSIFYNLLSNAIKYRSEARPLQVHVNCRRIPGGTIITCTDNGSGFDMTSTGEGVFKLYQRFHGKKGGRGIGLYLVKAHVEAMEGRIEVESHVNQGTTFSIYFQS